MISDLNKLGIVLKSLDVMKIGTVGVNTANLEAYRNALKGISIEQSVFALASKGATEEQIRQILVTNQVTANEVEAAMAKAGLTTATKALTQAEMLEIAAKNGVAKAEAEELLRKIGITATEEGQVAVKKQVTLEMIKQAVASGALSNAEAKQITTMLGLNAVEGANIGITNVLTASFTKLWAVITAHPIGAILTAIGAVAVGTIAYINKVNKDAEKALIEAHENAEKALEDTKTSLSNDKSELQSINSELEHTKDKIQEISSIGSPTLAEQNELNKLSTANAQLETQKSLLENNIKLKQKSAALDAKELLGTQVEMEYSNILDNSSITSSKKSYTYADHAKYQAFNLKNAYNIYMNALKKGNVRRQELAQKLIDASAGDIAELTSELLKIVESFKYDDGTIIEGYEDLYNEYMGMIYNLQSLTNPDTFLDIAKSVTVGTDIDYEKAISEAYALAYDGNFDVSKLNQDFVKALADVGIDESTIEYIFKLKQQEYQSVVDSINQKYNPERILAPTYLEAPGHVDTPEQTQQKELDRQNYEKQKEKIQAINDSLTEYARENPIEFQLVSSYDEGFALLDKYIEDEKKKAENNTDYVGNYITNAIARIYDEAKVQSSTFKIENPISLLSEDNIKPIDDYQNKLKELYAALNLLRTKEMTSSNIDELTKNFPELSKYIDNIDVLEEQIQALINENLILLKKEFDGVISEEALKELSEYTVKMENIDSSINSTVSAIDNITSAYQTLNKAVEEYNENGYVSLQTLEEIMKIKPEYLSAFIDENGKIKSSTDAYKDLVKIQLEEYKLSAKEAYDLARKKNAKAIKEAAEDYGNNKITLEEYERRIGALGLDDYRVAKEFIKSVEEQLEKNPDSILSPDSSPTSDFEQKTDLASQSITTLQQNLSSLQNALSDVSGYNNQIEAINNIIKAQGNLYTGYEHSRDLYQKQYENSLNNGILAKHGLSKLVKEKIESGAPFFNEDSIEKDIKFGNISITQQDYENINDAISWYNKVLEAEENLTKTKSEIDESELSKYDVLRKKSEAYIDTLKNSQKSITDTIDFNGNKATEEQYNNLILYQMGIRKVLEDRYKYESSLLETLTPETDQYTEQEKLVRECADGLAECDKNIKDWRLDMLRLELEAIDDEIDSINDKIKANQDEIDEKDTLISGAIGILNQEVKVQEGLRDVIQERIDALQEENDEHERALALEKAKYELQRAYSQRTVKLYSGEERGFIYTQDREAVRDAQEHLDKLEYEETIHALQEQVGYYDDIIDNLNAIKDSWSNISSAAQEFLEIENVIAKYGVGIKDSILSGSYDTDSLTQSYKGLLHLGEEFDNDLKKQEDLRSDLEKSIEQFQNGTITLEQCLTDIGTLLGKVYDISESELQEKTENILHSIGFLPSEADNTGNMVKVLEKEVKNSTDNIKDDMNQIAEDADDTSSIAAGKVTENLIGETDKQRIIITDFAGYIDYVFTTMCNTILSIFQLLSNAMKDIFAPANTELADIELGAMSNGSTTANDGKDLTQSASSIGEEYTTASTYQEGNAVLTPFQNEQFETLIKNVPNMSALIPYHAVFTPNLNNSPTSITPVVQNVTLTLPNVTNENGYNNLVDALKSLPLDTVQYTHKK